MYYVARGTVNVPDNNWHLSMEARAVRAELHPEVVASDDESLYCNKDIDLTVAGLELGEVSCLFVHYSPVQNLVMVELDFEESEFCSAQLFLNADQAEQDEDELVFACFRPGQGHKEAIFILPLDKYVVRNDEEICLSQIRYIMHIAELRLK